MKEYRVITTPRQDRLEQQVTTLLNDNWELHGPPTQSPSGGYLQAMIKQAKPTVTKETKAKKSAPKVSE